MTSMNENAASALQPPPLPPVNRFQLLPMEGPPRLFGVLEALLKSPGRILFELKNGRGAAVCTALVVIALICLGVYGIVTGTLSGGGQLFIAPAKIILGAALAVLICLPSLYIFLCLGGIDANLRAVAGELLAAVCLASLLLVGFAPVAWVFSQSTDSVALMAILHLVFWAIALSFGLYLLSRGGSRAATGHLSAWMVIFIVVCFQMMTSLRPIVGRADTFFPKEKMFFVNHAFSVLADQAGSRSQNTE